jgi:hypothetical protein
VSLARAVEQCSGSESMLVSRPKVDYLKFFVDVQADFDNSGPWSEMVVAKKRSYTWTWPLLSKAWMDVKRYVSDNAHRVRLHSFSCDF